MSGTTANKTVIDRAFANDSKLRKRIFDAIREIPDYVDLFEDIAQYHVDSQTRNGASASVGDDEPASKKRKLLNSSLPVSTAQKNQPREVILEARDISFSIPQRKKLHLGIIQYGTDINSPSTSFAIYTRNPATNEIDMEVPVNQFAYVLRLPVPEKAAKQYNFCLLPKSDSQFNEPIIWTVNHGPLKSVQVSNPELAKIASGPEDILENVLDFVLKKNGISLTLPTAEEFASATTESHRKGDKAYHVKAFRGSKDGFLFFLYNGIFFGFKKPLSFFAFEDVESISYTSVLQRTFNLNIAHRPSGLSDGTTADADAMNAIQEVEFSMLDQADFPGIDAYVKRHGLQDASLAESRRAKKLNAAANGKASVQYAGGEDERDGGEDTRTELEKAQQQMEDEEDEVEEDYDPGSEGDSEGSGASEEDDDKEYERERKKNKKGRNLVAEELGSEAEDVGITEDETEAEEDKEDEGDGAEDYDEEEEEEEDVEQAQHPHQNTAVPQGIYQGGWGYEEGAPDPDDPDQL
ncbi:uncharacterized protein Z518_05530 [Rhinocladiella mackenziei CBS 650.93]|uniref:Histone chaperone RTT106/FACT complex subunit SPT16-like middle domain-containing protein n=1 Tax=Rhinocladiella mackenziei CBS 650.93 TaxID=1442369 RepID=A0A0D2J6I8_9EURO|nr:uncharacterized protein Z518_05530 [Rhinocladiella mackenziei CBS 650.93]KIX04660.1 hypothetical protein Z518_05530 [Rhinocladiella mackenziei CBS 650.93]